MSYHFLDDKDPRIDVMFQGLEKMEKMLSVIEKMPKSLFNGERFLTDEELSKVLRVSRRTLQEYRTFGVVPYYMVQGKTLYKESDILKILEDSYKRCREEQRWVWHFSVFILCHFRLSSPFFLDDEIFFAKLYLFSETCGL